MSFNFNNRLTSLPTDIQDIIYKRNNDYNFKLYMFSQLRMNCHMNKYKQGYMNPHCNEGTMELRARIGIIMVNMLNEVKCPKYIRIYEEVDNILKSITYRIYDRLNEMSNMTYSEIHKKKQLLKNIRKKDIELMLTKRVETIMIMERIMEKGNK